MGMGRRAVKASVSFPSRCKINFVDKPSSHGSLKETEFIFCFLFYSICLGLGQVDEDGFANTSESSASARDSEGEAK